LHGNYELLVLDVMLPGLDGFDVLRKLRRESDLPILMLTARGDDIDRIVGLELGADDYLAKPFHTREVVARIRAILRRTGRSPSGRSGRLLEASGVRLDVGARTAVCDGCVLELTTMEFDLLRALMESAGRVLSRDALLDRIDGREAEPFDRSIDVHISHLRRKLGGDAPRIRTVRGVGYQFVLPASDPT
jgi:two-component system, OmpR family, response regulator CpxR